MLWIPQKGVLRREHSWGSVGSTTLGHAVTTGAAAGTKGTPTELITSTSFDAYWITIWAGAYGAAATASEGCLDILVGAATEDVLIPNLLMGYCDDWSAGRGPKMWHFPLYIPAGTRIAAQACGARTATAVRVGVALYGGDGYPPFRVGSQVNTYGVATPPNGTAVTPGASGAVGSWTQITASTSEDNFAVFPSWQPNADTNMGPRSWTVGIGIGSATEDLIAEDYYYGVTSNEAMTGPCVGMPAFYDMPSGSRLVMRASNHGTNDSTYQGALHCVS